MNDQHLDELLKRKKAASMKFDKGEKEFIGDFLARTAQVPIHHFPVRRIAAGFLLSGIAAALFFVFQTQHDPRIAGDGVRDADNAAAGKLEESVRFFGGDAALVFFGDELITGERESTAVPGNLVNVRLHAGNRTIDLSLACSDNDTFYLDSDGVSGNMIVSRCDASALILDVDLKIDGQTVRTAIPLSRSAGKHCYSAKDFS